MKALTCMVIRDGSTFGVKIKGDQQVWELKKMIKNDNDFAVDAKDIELYPAKKKDDKWLTMEDDEVKMLTNGLLLQSMKDMMRPGNTIDPTYPIDNVAFGFPSDVTTGEIHVLVDVPTQRETGFIVNGVRYPVTQGMDLYPPALVAFWKALGAVVEANAVVTLPKEIYLFGDPALGSQLFVRPCYPPLWKLCWKSIHDPLFPHLVILGNPGIGKTFFGFFILLQLARENKTVIYECGLSKSRYLFAGDTVVKGSQDDFVGILDLPTTYYIVDAVRPLKCPAMTILLTKPIHEVWFEFNEDKCDFRYMPVWAWDEILTCHSELYSKLALDVVTDCFRRWGGVPRYVLRYALVDTQQLLLEDALDVAKCDWVLNAIGKLEANCPESHRLLHYQVDSETFINHHVDFASHYVQDKVYKRLRDDNERRLVELLAASYNGSDNFTVLYTRLFERYVHSVLPHGGSFRIRRLIQPDGVCPSLVDNEDHYDEGSDDEEKSDDAMDTEGENVVAEDLDPGEGSAAAPVVWDIDGKKGIVHVPRQQPVEFNSDSEVATAAIGVYLRPTIKHDLSVDAIVKPDVVVTIAAKHPCKQKDLNDVLNLLGNPPAPRLFFVVPPNGFADFQYQQYVTQEGTPTTHLSASVRSIHQYVMQVTPSVQAGMTQHPSSDEGTKKRLRDE